MRLDVTPYRVRARALDLELIFRNLIDNAVKYIGDQAEPRIEIGARRDGNETICYVRDNGIGIDEQYLDRIFMIFQRLHARDEYPGTGVGLAVCKKIVEHHGGRIWADSRPGVGSTFYFTLPASALAE